MSLFLYLFNRQYCSVQTFSKRLSFQLLALVFLSQEQTRSVFRQHFVKLYYNTFPVTLQKSIVKNALIIPSLPYIFTFNVVLSYRSLLVVCWIFDNKNFIDLVLDYCEKLAVNKKKRCITATASLIFKSWMKISLWSILIFIQ